MVLSSWKTQKNMVQENLVPVSVNQVPLRFAILGCGRMGRHHSERLIADGRGTVVALLDPIHETATLLQQELWPDAAVCPDLRTLLQRNDIDAAILCTPTAEHFPQASQCLDRGWHVLCEKPLASNAEQIRSLVTRADQARRQDIHFSLAYQRRHSSLYRTLRREVRSGRWGKVRAIVSHNVEHWQQTIHGTWRDQPEQNFGGFITDAGSHKLDSIFYVTGLAPTEVFARTQKWGSHVEISASISALLTDGVAATIDFMGNTQYFGEDLHIHCEHADLLMLHGELWMARNGCRELLNADEPDSCPVTSFLDSIIDGAPELSPPDAAVPVYEITQAILASSQLGRCVDVVRV
jgi:predicted dehydrogenase